MKTKEKILYTARALFNEQGVADTSIRHIAKELGISHGNLIYHYPNKTEIIRALHEELLQEAVKINSDANPESFDVTKLWETTLSGFKVVIDYRFLFFDLRYLCKNDPVFHGRIKEIAAFRDEMYLKVIALSIKNGFMIPEEYEDMYKDLTAQIRIYSDNWLTSSAIYEDSETSYEKYARLLVFQFFPYLTKKGKESIMEVLR